MKTLLVIFGPTGVGKTALAIDVAKQLQTEIVNADSRQIYRELPIGTAAPTEEEQKLVKHRFVGNRSITEDYNAGMYEREALGVISELHKQHDTVVLTGGSMMYIDAVCKGLDELPAVSEATRAKVQQQYREGGIEWLQQEVQKSDPEYYAIVDRQNPQRLIHAIEITRQAGVPYSTLRSGKKAQRDFRIIQVGLYRQREELYRRIDQRVLDMMRQGLEEEARRVYPLRGINSLNTVGYKEMFDYFDGNTTREEAIALIQQHSRNYAKRQMTWWKTPRGGNSEQLTANSDIHWFDAATVKTEDILNLI